MTILPAKRPASGNGDENNDGSSQADSSVAERSVRRRGDEPNLSDSGSSISIQSRYSLPSTRGDKEDRKSRCLRRRYKDSKRGQERVRGQKRDRNAKRENNAEPNLENNNSPDNGVHPTNPEPSLACNIRSNLAKDGSGFNSEDEYDTQNFKEHKKFTAEEWTKRDAFFSRCLASLGYEIKLMHEDGACLFRAIADQVYGDQELHFTVRTYCMDYIVKNKDFFAAYVTEDFDKYVARKRTSNVHGNHLEIQALSEMYNRTIEVYCYQVEPINIFNGSRLSEYEPIRVSYHRMCHYNSITNPKKPSVGVGLGFPNSIINDRCHFTNALQESEELLIEQTMLEDKLKATDWEATNEALEEQVARESYISYYRDCERRLKDASHSLAMPGSSSTITSASFHRGSVSPKGSLSPKGPLAGSNLPRLTNSTLSTMPSVPISSFSNVEDASAQSTSLLPYNATEKAMCYANELKCSAATTKSLYSNALSVENRRNAEFQDWDEGIMAQALAESEHSYLEDLKRSSNRRYGSPGPSTSR